MARTTIGEQPIEDKLFKEKFEHLKYLINLSENYKTGIYSRAQMILAVTGVQLAFTISIVNNALDKSKPTALSIYFIITVILAVITQISTGFIIIKTILPHGNISFVGKVISKKTNSMPEKELRWLLSGFNHVVRKNREDFIRILNNSSLKDISDDLAHYYYNLCHIVSRRYKILRIASTLQMINFIFLLLIFIFSIILIYFYKK